jgi:methionyl-tRNA synthetase
MIDPFASAEEWGVDGIRYLVLRAAPFEKIEDSPVSTDRFSDIFNAELANGVGNTLQRTLALLERSRDGKVPAPGRPGPSEARVREAAERALAEHDGHASALRFSEAIGTVVTLLGAVDRHYAETRPWQLVKEGDTAGFDAALYAGAEAVRLAALLLWPYVPATAERIAAQLGQPHPERGSWEKLARWGALAPGTATTLGAPLFPRLELARA